MIPVINLKTFSLNESIGVYNHSLNLSNMFLTRFFLIATLVILSLSGFTQGLQVILNNFTINESADIPTVLRYAEKQTIPLETRLKTDGNNSLLSVNSSNPGFYVLADKKGKLFEFFYDGKNPVEFIFKDDDFKPVDRENVAHHKLLGLYTVLDSINRAIGFQVSSVSQVDPNYTKKKVALKAASDSIREQWNQMVEQLQKEYPSTVSAKSLTPLVAIPTRLSMEKGYERYDNHHAFYHRHFFDQIDLSDEVLLKHPLFFHQLSRFMSSYAGEFNDDLIRSFNYLVSLNPSPKVKSVLIKEYLTKALQENLMDAGNYIIQNHLDGCATDTELEKVVAIIQDGPLKKGNKIPSLQLKNVFSGQTQSLNSTLETKEGMKLVFFWRSGCPMCKEEIPRLSSLSSIAPSNIVLISIDENPETMDARLSENQYSMIGDRDSNLSNLGIIKTPTIVLLDDANTIVQTPHTLSELLK